MTCGVETRKERVTDRALRYRANQCPPAGPQRCELCGSKRFLVVDHRDGFEENGAPANLRWLCKSCNTRTGAEMAKQGKGRRTRQYNKGGAHTLAEYAVAAAEHRRGAHDAGGKIIHETPADKRSEYASEIWRRRHERYGQANPAAGAFLGTDSNGWEYWQVGGEYYRNKAGARGPMTEAGVPANVRHEGAMWHFERFVKPHLIQSNPRWVAGADREGWAREYETIKKWRAEAEGYRAKIRELRAELRDGKKRHLKSTTLAKIEGRIRDIGVDADYLDTLARDREKRIDDLMNQRYRHQEHELKNPAGDAAAAAFEEFHGYPSTEDLHFLELENVPSELAALGDLVSLTVRPAGGRGRVVLGEFGGAILATNGERNQLYVVGGDQSVDLADFGLAGRHERELLGELLEVVYFTTKTHLGSEGGEAEYHHDFGEESGGRPSLVYDTVNERLEVVGGAYTIEPEGVRD